MGTTLTAFERRVLEATFKLSEHGELLVASKLTALLREPETFSFSSHSCTNGYLNSFQSAEKLPLVVKRFLENSYHEIHQILTGADQTMIGINFESILDYEFNNLFQAGYNATKYADTFADYDQLTLEKIERLCRTAEFLEFIFDHYKNPIKLNIIYTRLRPYLHLTVLRLTSIEAFRKMVNRKELGKIPGCLIHKGLGKLSNNHKLSDFMQDIILSLATCSLIKKSAELVKCELDFLIEKVGEVKADALGIYNLSTGKISTFLESPIAKRRLAEALADPIEFRRNVLGHFDFFRASAPLVKVSIDAYVIQIKYFSEDDNKLKEFVAIHFHDDFSDFVFSSSLDDSENSKSLLKALRDFLIYTKGALPRTIYVDGFTNRLLHKYPHVAEFLKKRGVKILPSPNPNNKSSLERCLLTIQQKQLPKSLHYIGPGIKSKKPLSHPAKHFLIILNHKRNALAKWELARLYKYLIHSAHNANYYGKDGYTPVSRYEGVDTDSACTIDLNRYLPYLCFDNHAVSVVAGAIRVPLKQPIESTTEADKMRYRNIVTDKYENRSEEFNKKLVESKVDARIDSDNPIEAHIYLKDTSTKVGTMKLVERLPNNEHDRTPEQRSKVNARNKESEKIKHKLAQERFESLNRVNDAIGFDLREVTEESRASKELNKMSKSSNMGLDDFDNDRKLFDARKSRHKRKHKYGDDDELLESLEDTF